MPWLAAVTEGPAQNFRILEWEAFYRYLDHEKNQKERIDHLKLCIPYYKLAAEVKLQNKGCNHRNKQGNAAKKEWIKQALRIIELKIFKSSQSFQRTRNILSETHSGYLTEDKGSVNASMRTKHEQTGTSCNFAANSGIRFKSVWIMTEKWLWC